MPLHSCPNKDLTKQHSTLRCCYSRSCLICVGCIVQFLGYSASCVHIHSSNTLAHALDYDAIENIF